MKRPFSLLVGILLILLSYGALSETYRIFTSDADDIASQRMSLMIMSGLITSALVIFTILFWVGPRKKKQDH